MLDKSYPSHVPSTRMRTERVEVHSEQWLEQVSTAVFHKGQEPSFVRPGLHLRPQSAVKHYESPVRQQRASGDW